MQNNDIQNNYKLNTAYNHSVSMPSRRRPRPTPQKMEPADFDLSRIQSRRESVNELCQLNEDLMRLMQPSSAPVAASPPSGTVDGGYPWEGHLFIKQIVHHTRRVCVSCVKRWSCHTCLFHSLSSLNWLINDADIQLLLLDLFSHSMHGVCTSVRCVKRNARAGLSPFLAKLQTHQAGPTAANRH